MTLEDIIRSEKPFITPQQAARVIGCDPQYIRQVAHGPNPRALGFPTTVTPTRTRIPRLPFIRYVEEGFTGWL